MNLITEEQLELQSIDWFKNINYEYKNGFQISPDGNDSERKDFRDVILQERLLFALKKINTEIPKKYRKINYTYY